MAFEGRGPSESICGLDKDDVEPASFRAARLAHEGLLSPSAQPLFERLSDSRAQRVEWVLRNRTRKISVALDGVNGPHNLAAILRSCDAFGVQDVFFVDENHGAEGSESILHALDSPTGSKVSKGVQKWLSLRSHPDSMACVSSLKKEGYRIFVSSLDHSSVPIHQISFDDGPIAFVFGNEKQGVGADFRDNSDGMFHIPQCGFVESMNVSVACAVTLAAATTRAKQELGNYAYSLSPAEMRFLLERWSLPTNKWRPAKPTITRSCLTRLGVIFERQAICNGFFTNELAGKSLRNRLTASNEIGHRLSMYVQRRKGGALNESTYTGRCETLTAAFAGPCSLMILSATNSFEQSSVFSQFERLCTEVHDIFESVFQTNGLPRAMHSPEAQLQLSNSVNRVSSIAYRAAGNACGLISLTKILGQVNVSDLECLVLRACNLDSGLGITIDDLREVGVFLKDRYPGAETLLDDQTLASLEHPRSEDFSELEYDHLQLALRFHHAAWAVSQQHLAVVHRAGEKTRKPLLSSRMNLYEGLIADSVAEMSLADHPRQGQDSWALARALYELAFDVVRLREHMPAKHSVA